jgi:hypothetical protein
MDCPRANSFTHSKFYSEVSVISITLSARRNRSGGFWFASDLALDLLSEFQGTGNLRKNLWRPTRSPDDYRSVAKEPSQRGLLDGDAFDSRQKKFDSAAICEPRLYDDSFIGNGHLRRAAAHKTNSEKDRCYHHTTDARPSQRARSGLAPGYNPPRSNEQAHSNHYEDCGDQRMPQHHDPVEPRLILDDFARDEMFFGVAQWGSLKKGVMKYATGDLRRMMARSDGWSTAIRAKLKKSQTQLVALTGIEPVF